MRFTFVSLNIGGGDLHIGNVFGACLSGHRGSGIGGSTVLH